MTKNNKTNGVAHLLPLLLIDGGAILFSLSLAFYLRFYLNIFAFSNTTEADSLTYMQLSLTITPLWLAINGLYGLYKENYLLVGTEEYRRVINSITFGTVGLMILAFFLKKDYSRGWVLLAWICSLVVLTSSRYFYRHLRHSQRRRGIDIKNAVIVGINDEANYLFTKIKKSPHFGFSVLGFIDNKSSGKEVLGQIEDIEKIIDDSDIKAVILIASALSPDEIQNLCSKLSALGVQTYISPSLVSIISSRITIQPIAGVPLIGVNPVSLSGYKFVLKRALDSFAAILVSIVLLPFFAVIAILIKSSSKGPVLFRQERVGRNGKHFILYKFRTMIDGAEEELDKLKHLNEADGYIFKIKNDPRITAVGKFLRKYSLDEFPQLINVLKGSMSTVGPRPPLPSEVENYSQWELQRLGTLPGMTGLWQVSGRSELPFNEMVKLDIYYIENWSPIFDLYILFRTIPVILKSQGAY